MQAIHLPNLSQKSDRTITIQFDQNFLDLETLTPVEGVAVVTHRSNFLTAQLQAKTIVTLRCDRCLQQYNHRLVVDTEEMIWLTEMELDLENLPLDEDLLLEEMVETLPSDGHFQVENWIYEQLCLGFPDRQLCNPDCPGIEIVKSPEDKVDRRWAGLEKLKGQLPGG
jgi:uncharacterized protein